MFGFTALRERTRYRDNMSVIVFAYPLACILQKKTPFRSALPLVSVALKAIVWYPG
jgi:hypothetical protein